MDGLSKKFQSFHNLDIPPRKLLTQRLAALSSEPRIDMYRPILNPHNNINNNDQYYSPRVISEETLFHKYLPNSSVDDECDPYVSDEFRMYEFKVRKCTRSRSHDWTDCPFAHPGEKARRRCPRRFSYSGIMCPDFRRGSCVRGDTCEFSHGVFEYWLHPSRYRTEACKDGRSCMRKICFFAHTPGQLRSVSQSELLEPPHKHCAYCRCHRGVNHTISPTSVLDGNVVSPPTSPPLPPAHAAGGYSPISRFQVESSSGMTQFGNSPPSTPPFSPAQYASGYSPVSRFQVESTSMIQNGNAGSRGKEVMTPGAMNELMHNINVMNMNAMKMKAIGEVPTSNPEWVHYFPPAQYAGGKSPVSRFHVESSSSGMTQHGNAGSKNKEVMTPGAMNELMNNMKTMNMNAIDQTPNSIPEWADSFAVCKDNQRLIFSPSPSLSGSSRAGPEDRGHAMNNLNEDELVNGTAIGRPDIEWVNDLLT